MRKLCAAFRIWKRTWRALTGPLIENGIPTEALIAHVLVAFRSCSSAPSLSLLLGRLGGFAAYCFCGNCRFWRAGGLRESLDSGLGEANARLITIGELD